MRHMLKGLAEAARTCMFETSNKPKLENLSGLMCKTKTVLRARVKCCSLAEEKQLVSVGLSA